MALNLSQDVLETHARQEDIWLWKLTKLGKYSFACTWDNVRHSGQNFDLANMIWFRCSSPKMSMCCLRALKGKLPTKSFLKSLGITDNDLCVLRKHWIENIQHLFFECPCLTYIWRLCKLKLGILDQSMGSLIEEAKLLQYRFTHKLSRHLFQGQLKLLQCGISGKREIKESSSIKKGRRSSSSRTFMRI